MKIQGILEVIKNREVGYRAARKVFRFYERRKRDIKPFADTYIFDNRQMESENLMLVLLGFQPFYWDAALDRVKRNVEQFKESIDVCLCVPCGANTDTWGGGETIRRKIWFFFSAYKR